MANKSGGMMIFGAIISLALVVVWIGISDRLTKCTADGGIPATTRDGVVCLDRD
jgi:hypothetical protein